MRVCTVLMAGAVRRVGEGRKLHSRLFGGRGGGKFSLPTA